MHFVMLSFNWCSSSSSSSKKSGLVNSVVTQFHKIWFAFRIDVQLKKLDFDQNRTYQMLQVQNILKIFFRKMSRDHIVELSQL